MKRRELINILEELRSVRKERSIKSGGIYCMSRSTTIKKYEGKGKMRDEGCEKDSE